jgi:hypothetical protein
MDKNAMESLWRSGRSSRALVIFFLSKSMFSFQELMMDIIESYGPGFVEALKGDRMSLYSADLRVWIFILLVAGVLYL